MFKQTNIPKRTLAKYWQLLLLVLIVVACGESYTPKPRGYFRLDFPDKQYSPLQNKYPYSFEIPNYTNIVRDTRNPDKKNWITVTAPNNNVEIHISYYDLSQENKTKRQALIELMEDTRELAYKHSIKANAINEQIFINPKEQVFGTIYKIKGNAASPMQFFLTDSTKHFLRGAFYIREVPDIDSLKPVIDFYEPDIIRMIETTNWN